MGTSSRRRRRSRRRVYRIPGSRCLPERAFPRFAASFVRRGACCYFCVESYGSWKIVSLNMCQWVERSINRSGLHRRACRKRRDVYGARQPHETAVCWSTRLRNNRRGRGGKTRSTVASCAGTEVDWASGETGDSLEADRRLPKPGVALRGMTSESQFHRLKQALGLLAVIRRRR